MAAKGQLSAEMLILLAVILAVVLLVASQLLKTANNASGKVDEKSQAVFEKSDAAIEAAKGNAGDYCVADSDCKSSVCGQPEGKCA